MQPMTDEQKFLFDLQGFLVVRAALDPATVAGLRADCDAHGVCDAANDPSKSRFSGFLEWGDDWRGLVDHAAVLPILTGIIGEKFRLDHAYGMAMRHDGTPGGEGLHHEGGMFDHGCFYATHGNRVHNGLVVVSYALCEVPPGGGGFCCIPGTHKSLFPPPQSWYGVLDNPLLVHVPMRAGDMLVFTEALTHGTMPWTCTTHERRSILLKYAPGYMQWAGAPIALKDPARFTARQRNILAGPSVGSRVPVMKVA